MTKPIDDVTANRIFDLLVEKVGVRDHWRADFVSSQGEGCREYRIQGDLGFGGKFYNTDHCYVGCYPEDDTPQRLKTIENTNTLLAQMQLGL